MHSTLKQIKRKKFSFLLALKEPGRTIKRGRIFVSKVKKAFQNESRLAAFFRQEQTKCPQFECNET